MSKLQYALEQAFTFEQVLIEYYGELHAEIKQNRRAAFALANEISATERHLDVLMQQLIRKCQDLEVQLAELLDEKPAQDQ